VDTALDWSTLIVRESDGVQMVAECEPVAMRGAADLRPFHAALQGRRLTRHHFGGQPPPLLERSLSRLGRRMRVLVVGSIRWLDRLSVRENCRAELAGTLP
jgi:hypothetical protein